MALFNTALLFGSRGSFMWNNWATITLHKIQNGCARKFKSHKLFHLLLLLNVISPLAVVKFEN